MDNIVTTIIDSVFSSAVRLITDQEEDSETFNIIYDENNIIFDDFNLIYY